MGNHTSSVVSDTQLEMAAEHMEARMRKTAEIALQCQAKEKELRAMHRDLTAHIGEALALYGHLKAQWQSTALGAEDGVSRRHEQEIAALRKELEDARQGKDRMEIACLEQKRACERAIRERDDMALLLSQRTSELGAIQDLLPRFQSTTDTEVVELVTDLNYEISQAAIALSDSLDSVTKQPPSSAALKSSASFFKKRYGEGVASLLLKPSPEPALQLQLGLQGLLADRARTYVHRWSFASPSLDLGLLRIEKALDEREPIHVSAHWKSLGRKYAKMFDGESLDPANVANALALHWADALQAVGYCLGQDETSADSFVLTNAGKQLEEVSKAILKLNTAMGETSTSGRMRCCLVDHGAPFDAEKMAAYFEDESESREGAQPRCGVLCAIEVGLKREDCGAQEVVLVKPKVITELEHWQ